jgi:hypothetical protein
MPLMAALVTHGETFRARNGTTALAGNALLPEMTAVGAAIRHSQRSRAPASELKYHEIYT